jgi:hypothetical protein
VSVPGCVVRRGRCDCSAHERQSSIAARTRSVTSAAVAFHANGMEISTSGYDVIRTANSRRSGAATIHPSNRLLNCLPAATTAASNSALRSRGIVAESKIAIGINSIIAVASLATRRPLHTGAAWRRRRRRVQTRDAHPVSLGSAAPPTLRASIRFARLERDLTTPDSRLRVVRPLPLPPARCGGRRPSVLTRARPHVAGVPVNVSVARSSARGWSSNG